MSPVSLSIDARDAIEVFRELVYLKKAELDGKERDWWLKTPAHVLRLCGTLAYLDWARRTAGQAAIVEEPNRIEVQFVEAAIRLVKDYFWPHARAALRQIGLSERHANSRRVLRWIRANGVAEVSREDVRRKALGQRLDAEETQKLIDGLVKAGWFRKVTVMTGARGKPARRWAVNPRLSDTADNAGNAENG